MFQGKRTQSNPRPDAPEYPRCEDAELQGSYIHNDVGNLKLRNLPTERDFSWARPTSLGVSDLESLESAWIYSPEPIGVPVLGVERNDDERAALSLEPQRLKSDYALSSILEPRLNWELL